MQALLPRLSTYCVVFVTIAGGCVHRPFEAARDVNLLSSTSPECGVSHVGLSSPQERELRDQLASVDPTQFAVQVTQPSLDYPFSLSEAVRLAMKISPVVRVAEGGTVVASGNTFFDIQANEEAVVEALAAFDTTFETAFRSNSFNRPPEAFFGPGLAQPEARDEFTFNFGWTRRTELGGRTAVSYNPDPGYLFIPGSLVGFNPRHISELEFLVEQPLLKGAGREVNLAPIEVSRIDVEQSDWEFKQSLISSVSSVVFAYWELYASDVTVQAIEEVLPTLEEIVGIQQEAFKAEWVTQTEVAKAEAQLYEFRQEYEAALSDRQATELRLRNLIGLSPSDGRKLIPSTEPLDHRLQIDLPQAILAALDNQPDLVQQRLNVRLRTIDKKLALNGRRLQLDAFAIFRRNGLAENLDDAINQMFAEDFVDWQLGVELSVPLGRRQAQAAVRAADYELLRARNLLDQQVFSIRHDLQNTLRAIEFDYRQYEQSVKWLESAEQWVDGAKLRYQNPNVVTGGSNVLITNLNEYLNSLRLRKDAATATAELLADYNADLVRLEEQKGTLLDFFAVIFQGDPCSVAQQWEPVETELPSEENSEQASEQKSEETSEENDQSPAGALPPPADPPTRSDDSTFQSWLPTIPVVDASPLAEPLTQPRTTIVAELPATQAGP